MPPARSWEIEGSQAGNNGATALEQTITEAHPEQVERPRFVPIGTPATTRDKMLLIR